MLPGDYLLGLLAIITGLAISAMVTNLHGLLVNRRVVRWDWLALCAATFVFFIIVNSWGVSYRSFAGLRSSPRLWMFIYTLAEIIPLYLAARAAFPDSFEASKIDLAQHYARISRYFWVALAIAFILYLVLSFYFGGFAPVVRRDWLAEVTVLLMIPLIVSQDRRIHRIIVPAILLLFCVFALPRALLG